MRPLLVTAVLCLLAVSGWSAENPFYEAIRNDNLAGIRHLARKDVGARDLRGTTPLMYSAALGSFQSMKILVEAGADVNAANDFGATPLMWCAGDVAKVRYLLSKGASVTARSKIGRTPLLIAAMYDGSAEIAGLMIDKGADVKARDEAGMSVLAAAASVNNLDVARLLLGKGADPNTVDGGGFTPLLVAAGNGNRSAEMVKLLIDHGAAANVVSGEAFEIVKNGPLLIGRLTPLMLAAGQASRGAVDALVKAGAEIDARDVRKMTALAIAIATDHADPGIVRFLLSKGADREPALHWARTYRNPEILRALGLPVEKAAVEKGDAASGADRARSVPAAIEASVGLLQRTSAEFLDRGGCLGCHSQHITGMAVAAARASGVKVDTALEAAQANLTASLRGGLEQTLYQVLDPPSGADSQQFSLIQMGGSKIPPSMSSDSLVFHIAAMQRKEGDWPNYGVVRPPIEDGGFQHTAKGIRALQLYMIPGRKAEFAERIARAAAWLKKESPRSTEDRTMQLLGIRWAAGAAPQDRVKELIALQRSNGGWSQTEDLSTDAYATGEALYALHETGMSASDPVYRKGVEYLLRTQKEDGSWLVKTRAATFQPYFESGFPHGHDQWVSAAGTAWAAIGLSYTVAGPR